MIPHAPLGHVYQRHSLNELSGELGAADDSFSIAFAKRKNVTSVNPGAPESIRFREDA
jgi:hypothetical protein